MRDLDSGLMTLAAFGALPLLKRWLRRRWLLWLAAGLLISWMVFDTVTGLAIARVDAETYRWAMPTLLFSDLAVLAWYISVGWRDPEARPRLSHDAPDTPTPEG